MKHGSLLVFIICHGLFALAVKAPLAAKAAEGRYTELNPKYQQRPQTNSIDSINVLEKNVVSDFRTFLARFKDAPRVYVTVNDRNLAAFPDSEELSGLRIAKDIEADLQQILRTAGLIVIDSENDTGRCVRIEVQLDAKKVQVHEMEGVDYHLIPDIRVKAKTIVDARIVGQAQTLQFLGRDAQAFRAYERIGIQNLVRALGIMLLYDFAHNHVVDVAFAPVSAIPKAVTEVTQETDPNGSNCGTNGLNSNASSLPHPNATSTASAPPTVETGLLALKDREQVLKQVIEALKTGKS